MRPLKILHTADWHLGLVSWRSHREVDRFEEQKECLERLVRTAKEERVDLVIHAGDLFHQYYHPPKEAIRLAADTIMGLLEVAPFVWVIGNHDWYAVEALRKMFPPEMQIIRDMEPRHFPGISVVIFPIPYVPITRFLADHPGEEVQDRAQAYLRLEMQKWSSHFDPHSFHILVGHLTVEELAFYAEANASREVFFKRADFPPGFSYGALGHLHGYTVLQDPFVICYPSSLVPESFKDSGQKGGFVLVELSFGEKPRVSPVFFETSYLVSVNLDQRVGVSEVRRLIEGQVKANRKNYVRLRIPENILSPEWVTELRHLEGDGWKVVVVETLWEGNERKEAQDTSFDVAVLPELFARFSEEEGLPGEVVRLFEMYYHRVLEEQKRV